MSQTDRRGKWIVQKGNRKETSDTQARENNQPIKTPKEINAAEWQRVRGGHAKKKKVFGVCQKRKKEKVREETTKSN